LALASASDASPEIPPATIVGRDRIIRGVLFFRKKMIQIQKMFQNVSEPLSRPKLSRQRIKALL
jgi:hypothetical protein